MSLSLSLSVTRGSCRWSRLLSSDPVAVRAHPFFPWEGAFFRSALLLLECASAGVSFCWRGWRTLLLAWLEELQMEVCIESTHLLRDPDCDLGSWLHILYDTGLCTSFGGTISRR